MHGDEASILESFHMKCQRRILGISWPDRVRNVKVAVGRLADRSWKRYPGRTPKCWLDQICNESQRQLADMWSDAVKHGQRGVMQRSSTTAC